MRQDTKKSRQAFARREAREKAYKKLDETYPAYETDTEREYMPFFTYLTQITNTLGNRKVTFHNFVKFAGGDRKIKLTGCYVSNEDGNISIKGGYVKFQDED